jgi:hypothetical protein
MKSTEIKARHSKSPNLLANEMTIAAGSTLLLSGKKIDDQLRNNKNYCYSIDQIEPKEASQ